MPEDKIIQKLLEHDKRLDRIEERVEKTLTLDDYLKGQIKFLPSFSVLTRSAFSRPSGFEGLKTMWSE